MELPIVSIGPDMTTSPLTAFRSSSTLALILTSTLLYRVISCASTVFIDWW